MRRLGHSLAWPNFSENSEAAIIEIIVACEELNEEQRASLKRHLVAQRNIYERRRVEPDFWKVVEGKEALRAISGSLGFADWSAAERFILALCLEHDELVPEEIIELRQYVAGL